jgi:hypothetical protein
MHATLVELSDRIRALSEDMAVLHGKLQALRTEHAKHHAPHGTRDYADVAANDNADCPVCAVLDCPCHDARHYAADGCPACSTRMLS